MNALNLFSKFENGDLVWVRNINDGNYYILQISDAKIRVSENQNYRDCDIAFYMLWNRMCCVGNHVDVNKYFDFKKIISRPVLQKRKKDDIKIITNKIFEEKIKE